MGRRTKKQVWVLAVFLTALPCLSPADPSLAGLPPSAPLISSAHARHFQPSHVHRRHVKHMDMILRPFDIRDASGRIWRIFTALPAGKAPREGWPVVWLTDGNRTFPLAVREKPQALLVAIGYPLQERKQIVIQRYFDLTTPALPGMLPLLQAGRPPLLPSGVQAEQPVLRTGGSVLYQRFILEKLRSFINARFPVNKNRQILYGHSLGGLFVLHTLLNNRQGFQTWCAADPSIWWNGHEIMDKLAALTGERRQGQRVKIRITVSGKKSDRRGLSKEDRAKIARLRKGPNGKDVFEILRQAKNIEAGFKAYGQETHGSLIAVSLRDCLSFSSVLPFSSAQGDDHNRGIIMDTEVKHEKTS